MDRVKLRDMIARAIRAGGRVSGDQHVVNIVQALLPEFEREHNAGRAEGKAVMESKVRELLDNWHKLERDGIHGRQLRERVLGETSPDDFHEEDEPVQDVVTAFDRGAKGVTRAQWPTPTEQTATIQGGTTVRPEVPLMNPERDDIWERPRGEEILP